MRRSQRPLVFFLLSALLPFLVSFVLFLYAQRLPIFTPPDVYLDRLKLEGAARYSPSPLAWKSVLARDPLCAEADAVIIGSSRLREVNRQVVGASVCNLHVPGLNAVQFAVLADALAPMQPGRRSTVYVGLDHLFFWLRTDKVEWIDFKGFETSRVLWMAWRAAEPLSYFSPAAIGEAIRRSSETDNFQRFQNEEIVWFPDGHVLYPHYYVLKSGGIYPRIDKASVEESVRAHFGEAKIRPRYLVALKAGVEALRQKGYIVYLFWEPLSPNYLAAAQRYYPRPFQGAIAALESMRGDLKIDRYVPARDSLDASRFGCTERDLQDAIHVDIDCMDRFFAAVFRFTSPSARRLSEALMADLTSVPSQTGPQRTRAIPTANKAR